MRRTPLARRTPLNKRRPVPRSRKSTVRLKGTAMLTLRLQCWQRDGRMCKECGAHTIWQARYDGDPLAYDMAHIVSRGAGGADTLENVRTLCHGCHVAEHAGRLS